MVRKEWLVGAVLVCVLAVIGDDAVDKFGQSKASDWPGKITSDSQLKREAEREWETLKDVKLDLSKYDRHGGLKEGLGLKATGWFRKEKVNGRWWLVTPEGNRFFMQGCDGTSWSEGGYSTPLMADGKPRPELQELPDKNEYPDAYARFNGEKVSFLTANLQRKYGKDYVKIVEDVNTRRLLKWGFNSLAKWCYNRIIGDMPFVVDTGLWGTRRFGRWIDMYDPSFDKVLDKTIKACVEKYRSRSNLIGYACENENGWNHWDLAKNILPLDGGWAVKGVFIDFLAARHGGKAGVIWNRPDAMREELINDKTLSPAAVSEDDAKAFVLATSEYYHKKLLAAYRKYDKHHLVMGAAHCPMQSREWIEGACKYMDFIGINTYDIYGRWSRTLDDLYRRYDIPFAILEYSFVVEGRGYRNYAGTNTVRDTASRGLAYRYYVEREVVRPNCIGMGYFILWDQPVTRRSLPAGENFNFGLMSQCDQPYEEMLKHVVVTNHRMFDLHDGKLEPTTEMHPAQLLVTGVSDILDLFMPETLSQNVGGDLINGDKFNNVKARLKITNPSTPRPSVVPIGVIKSGKAVTQVVARAFLYGKGVVPEDYFLVEVSSDNVHFRPVETTYTQVWKGSVVTEYQLRGVGFRDNERYVRLSFKTTKAMPLWVNQLSHLRVE